MVDDSLWACWNCRAWLPYKDSALEGICIEKCKWLVKKKRKFIAKGRDPFKGANNWCTDFLLQE